VSIGSPYENWAKAELRTGSAFENCPTLIQEGIFNNFYIKFMLNKHFDHYYEMYDHQQRIM
jgi:hypothetical protein